MKHFIDASNLRIEKNVPMPEETPVKPRVGPRDILTRMKVGDSVVLPAEMRAAFYAAAKHIGVAVTSTRVPNTKTFRMWKARKPKKAE